MRSKDFHYLNLGEISTDELVTKFTLLLCYVPYLKEENEEVKLFLNCLPLS